MRDAGSLHPISPRIILALGLLAATAPFSLDAYLPALPEMADEFGASASIIQFSLTACLLGLGAGQLFAGPLGDRYGRRVPMLVGSAAYTLASVGCALAPSAEILIACRIVQGLAGAVAVVLSRAVVHDIASGRVAARVYSQMAAISSAAPVVAPVVGALIIGFAGWRGVFVVLAGLGVVMMLAVQFVIGETHPADRRISAAIGPVLRSFSALLRDRVFRGYALVVMFTAALLFSYISSAPFVLQDVFGFTPLGFALTFATVGAGLVCTSLLNARLLRRFAPTRLLVVMATVQLGGVLALGAVVAVKVALDWQSTPALVLCLVWAVVPCAAITPTCISLAMARSGERAGSASALLGVCMFLTGAVVSPLSGAGSPALIMAVLMLSASICGLASIHIATGERSS